MIFRDDVVFLIDEYASRFGEVPVVVSGGTFPRQSEWAMIVRAIRRSLDSGKPMMKRPALSQAA